MDMYEYEYLILSQGWTYTRKRLVTFRTTTKPAPLREKPETLLQACTTE